ncbi:MAG: hypothetical protein NUW37_13480 [Planctomycetes bacterium]|nr:hypothetical protein [Planctomycetota bacterium]
MKNEATSIGAKLTVLASAMLSSACATNLPGIQDDDEFQTIKTWDEPLFESPVNVVFAYDNNPDVNLGLSPQNSKSGSFEKIDGEENSNLSGEINYMDADGIDWPLARSQFETQIMSELQKSELFAGADLKTSAEGSNPMEASWRENRDVVLRLRVNGYSLRYEGVDVPQTIWSGLLWGVSLAGGLFIPKENYSLTIEFEVALECVRTGSQFWSAVLTAMDVARFSDIERGFNASNLLLIRGEMEMKNWQRIESFLAPRVFRCAVIEATSKIWNDRNVILENYNNESQLFSICIGPAFVASDHENDTSEFSSRSAEEFSRFVDSHRNARIDESRPPYTSVLLTGGEATGRNVRKSVKDVAERIRNNDELIVYISTDGFIFKPESNYELDWKHFLIRVVDSANSEKDEVISLEYLFGAFRELSIRRLIVVFDIDFFEFDDSKSQTAFPEFVGFNATEFRAMFAAGRNQKADCDENSELGVFTRFLTAQPVENIESIASEEVFSEVSERVQKFQLVRNRIQKPEMLTAAGN